MNKITLAYAAGFYDGEGTVYINNLKHNIKNGRTIPSHCLVAEVTNTNKEVLMCFKEYFRGNIKYYSVDKLGNTGVGSKKPQWRWNVSGNQAKDFFEAILPYLIVKRKQAELAISFQINKKDLLNKERPFQLVEVERREWYKQEISKLNQGKG